MSKDKGTSKIGDIIESIVEWPKRKPQRVYAVLIEGSYDGDNSDAVNVFVFADKERAKSVYYAEAEDSETYFLRKFEENAVINRDDDTMFCECYSRSEEYCRWHNKVYVKQIEL